MTSRRKERLNGLMHYEEAMKRVLRTIVVTSQSTGTVGCR